MKLEIIYEDDNIIAYNKPTGLLSIPDRFNAEIPNLYRLAKAKYETIIPVHRLDRDTSGIICFAKNEERHKYLSLLFQGREIEKYYIALVNGRLIKPSGSIELAITENMAKRGTMMVHKRGKPAHTDYATLQEWNGYTLLRLQIHTGRTHQIRVHLQHLGHPVVADPIYSNGKGLYVSSLKKNFKNSDELGEEKAILNRLALHAAQLKFVDMEGKEVNIEAPLPKDMNAAIKQLNKWST
ncbi:RNA pseudouridine synthase [Taibaiella sp. KBW10]|uniref:RluA family pseudouridine synthase n=1 Tax=Taibaiella sp. KBW10 TaxID=2153357 RepID=UPI000F5ACFC7|nr:RluA family pseudouridine synthase [Taibaiella sp. KBW10]RQO29693.1 RNA pseudouridine synthase [Taibaiella sp. KBW10]